LKILKKIKREKYIKTKMNSEYAGEKTFETGEVCWVKI
jgi:hypothetical protein